MGTNACLQSILTSICPGFDFSAFGSSSVRMPFLYLASALSVSTEVGSEKLREKEP